MARATPRRRTPPVNAELYKIERAGARIWTGSAPAFATREQSWVPTSTGARQPVGTYSVTVPVLFGPAEGEPPDPDFPVDPDETPPPPAPVDESEHPYEPPDTVPAVDPPDPGTYQDALADRPGYVPAVADAPFRPRFYLDGADSADKWEYDVALGGLHYSLGVGAEGIVDRTGNGRHGYAIAAQLGATAGKLADGDGSAYFDGIASRVVTPWDPFEDFGKPPRPPAGFYTGPPFSADYGLWYVEYHSTGNGPGYGNVGNAGWTHSGYPEWRITDGATRVVQLSGWARRQDRSNGHLLFSHTGFEGPRCWVAKDSNDVCLALSPVSASEGGGRFHDGGWWPNAWPADDQWTHFLIEIQETGGVPIFRRRRNIGGTVTYGGGYPDYGGYVEDLVSSGHFDPADPDAAWDVYRHISGWDRRAEGRLWINGVQAGSLSGNELAGLTGVATDWVSLNAPIAVPIPADPDRVDWPWVEQGGYECRPFQRGHLMVGGVALPTPTQALYPDLFDWDGHVTEYPSEHENGPYYHEPDGGYPERESPNGLWREGRRASAWKGSIDEFAVHKFERRYTTKDLGIRPASSAWPGPTLVQLVNTDPSASGLFAANGASATPMTVVEPGEGEVQVIPRVGDRVYWRHAGQTFARTIDGIEEREDFGFYRLLSQRGE